MVLGAKLVRDDITTEVRAIVLVSLFFLFCSLFHVTELQKKVTSLV